MTRFPRRRATLALATLLVLLIPAARAAADPIAVGIQIVSGTVEVSRSFDQPAAQFTLNGNKGFVLSGGGVSTVPGGCDPCFGGDRTGLPPGVFAHNGQVTFGSRTGEFDLFIGGGGEFDFSAAEFTLPFTSSEPVVFTAPFSMTGMISVGPEAIGGSLADMAFDLSGAGMAAATFVPRDFVPGLGQEFVFDHARFEFATTPEPGTLILLSAGALALRLKRGRPRIRSVRNSYGHGSGQVCTGRVGIIRA